MSPVSRGPSDFTFPLQFFGIHHEGRSDRRTNNHRPQSVRPNKISSPNSNSLLTPFFVTSLEEAVQNALKNYFPRPEATANVRTQFYKNFQHEADEHDKDFVGKYNADLDTTLIFVCLLSFFINLVTVLTWILWRIGWSVLCSHIRFHHRCPDPAPTRLQPIELRHPLGFCRFHRPEFYGEDPSEAQQRFSLDWPRSQPRPRPSHPFLKFVRLSSRRIYRHAG